MQLYTQQYYSTVTVESIVFSTKYEARCLASMFNNQILRILTQNCSPCKNSRQIMANAIIHSKRQNSRLPWIPWIR